MEDYTIFIVGCFLLVGFTVEIVWTAFVYAIRRLEYFFYHRYLDKVSREVMMEYMESPAGYKND